MEPLILPGWIRYVVFIVPELILGVAVIFVAKDHVRHSKISVIIFVSLLIHAGAFSDTGRLIIAGLTKLFD